LIDHLRSPHDGHAGAIVTHWLNGAPRIVHTSDPGHGMTRVADTCRTGGHP